MKDCAYYLELASRELDGDLSAQEREELTLHLRSCESCGQKFAAYGRIKAVLGGMECDPPPRFAAGTMYKLGLEKKSRRFAIGPFTIFAAAAAVIALSMSGMFGNLFGFFAPSSPDVTSAGAGAEIEISEDVAPKAANLEPPAVAESTLTAGWGDSLPGDENGSTSEREALEDAAPEAAPAPSATAPPSPDAALGSPDMTVSNSQNMLIAPDSGSYSGEKSSYSLDAGLPSVSVPPGYSVSIFAIVRGDIPEEFKNMPAETLDGVLYIKVPPPELLRFIESNGDRAELFTEGGFLDPDSGSGLVAVIPAG